MYFCLVVAAAFTGSSALVLRDVDADVKQTPTASELCPCVGVEGREGNVMQPINSSMKLSIVAAEEYGSTCKAWDDDNYPGCKDGQTPGKGKEWCAMAWCYVDPCNCNITPAPVQSFSFSDSQVQGKPLYYSYDTCGGSDQWSEENNDESCVAQTDQNSCEALSKCAYENSMCVKKELLDVCTSEKDTDVWGSNDCQCVGITNRTGFSIARAGADGENPVHYPPGVGSWCNAWEQYVDYPGCTGDNPPDWCSQKWCYVDPCQCNIADDPVITFSFPDAKYQGKALFYSYSTCGGSDSWTGSNNDGACVNQNDQTACDNLASKCSWTGSKCVGKDIVDACN